MNLLEAHIKVLQRLKEASPDGIVASELISDRQAREYMLERFSREGYILRRRKFRGERIYITEKGLNLLSQVSKSEGDGKRLT